MEFCSGCSIEYLGKDFQDFAGLISKEQEAEGYGVQVNCSRCGEIYVDSTGKRLSFAKDIIDADLVLGEFHEILDLRSKK